MRDEGAHGSDFHAPPFCAEGELVSLIRFCGEKTMAKSRAAAFFCRECGYESAKWMGQCPGCRAWNTFVEAPAAPKRGSVQRGLGGAQGLGMGAQGALGGAGAAGGRLASPVKLSEISIDEQDRMSTGYGELDRVLGSGIVAGSMVLVGGDPGIGKSTLLLQVCRNLAAAGRRVLYISGEESLKQVKLRAGRIGEISGELFFLCETAMGRVEEAIGEVKPDVAVIDSIQTMYCDSADSAPGSVGQIRESTAYLMQIAKGLGVAMFIVGHVTKEGTVAGPRLLEHMVDTVLYFEGERNAAYRIIRGVKNRFGSTNEIGVFEMTEAGLAEVLNPSEYMLNGRPEGASGAVVACSMEGTRPILLEVQALVTRTNFAVPRRTAAGADYNRVNLLAAVLEKRCRYDLSQMDVYVNIAGGMRMNEPALDLAIAAAMISSYKDIPVDESTMIFGEVGLSGEVRAVSMAEQRVSEAVKLGFKTCILPRICLERMKRTDGIRLCGVRNLREAIEALGGSR